MSSNYNQIIENVCGPNVKIHTIFDLRFLRWRGPIELLLRIPLHKKKAALNGKDELIGIVILASTFLLTS